MKTQFSQASKHRKTEIIFSLSVWDSHQTERVTVQLYSGTLNEGLNVKLYWKNHSQRKSAFWLAFVDDFIKYCKFIIKFTTSVDRRTTETISHSTITVNWVCISDKRCPLQLGVRWIDFLGNFFGIFLSENFLALRVDTASSIFCSPHEHPNVCTVLSQFVQEFHHFSSSVFPTDLQFYFWKL